MIAKLFIGLPAAGKTTYIRNNIKGFQIVSADELKFKHPDYDYNNPTALHEWSVKEAEKIMNELSDTGVNICMDSGGVNNSYSLRIIKMLKTKGYYVEIIFIDTPLDVCLSRNKIRTRTLPESIILEKAEKLAQSVENQRKIADSFIHIEYKK